MPSNDAGLPRRATRKASAGQVTTVPVSRLRRWVNRSLLATSVALVSVGLYRGGAHLSAQQVERLTVMGDVQHIDTPSSNRAMKSRIPPSWRRPASWRHPASWKRLARRRCGIRD